MGFDEIKFLVRMRAPSSTYFSYNIFIVIFPSVVLFIEFYTKIAEVVQYG